ncbi:MAG: CD225/dispanin family protein [Bacteroidales bacterium]|nr:CD225/dispanin family protein [Bacteroidales bacterium]
MLVWSILSTVLCCVPTGIVAIIYSARVDKLWYSGDRDGARTASKRAKTFVIIGAVLGIIVGIVYAAFIMRMSPEQMSEMLEMYGM